MVTCSVKNCTNNSHNSDKKFFRFPTDGKRCMIWMEFCQREKEWFPNENQRICNDHFDESQYENNRLDGRKILTPNAIPTLHSEFPKQENCEIFDYDNVLSFENCVVLLGHNYAKVWSDDNDDDYNDTNYWRNETERLNLELQRKNQELLEAKEIIKS